MTDDLWTFFKKQAEGINSPEEKLEKQEFWPKTAFLLFTGKNMHWGFVILFMNMRISGKEQAYGQCCIILFKCGRMVCMVLYYSLKRENKRS